MPIFEFYCKKCESQFEVLILKNDESDSMRCPHCNNRDVEKLFSTFAFCSDGHFSSNKGLSCTACAKTSCTGCSK